MPCCAQHVRPRAVGTPHGRHADNSCTGLAGFEGQCSFGAVHRRKQREEQDWNAAGNIELMVCLHVMFALPPF